VQRCCSVRTGFEVSCRGGWDFRDNLVDTVVSPSKQNAGQGASSPETSAVSVQENRRSPEPGGGAALLYWADVPGLCINVAQLLLYKLREVSKNIPLKIYLVLPPFLFNELVRDK
jgi:hypothetical protein